MSDLPLFDDLVDDVVAMADGLVAEIERLPLDKQIEALNRVRQKLHAVSPFRDQPVDCVLWVDADRVRGNDYNPNAVAPPEMRLLQISIERDGYTQPVVGWETGGDIEVVDGEHRTRVGKSVTRMRERLHGRLPVTLVNQGSQDRNNRIAATIRHNRARGVHGVMPMTEIVAELLRRGWTDDEVARELGMDADEVLRFKQNKGLPELFADHAYSKAWD